MRKTIKIFLYLSTLCLFLVAFGLTAEASITTDDTEMTITVSGEADITLDDIWASLDVGNNNLTNHTDGTWSLNYTLDLKGSTTLMINPTDGATGCTWLKLNSSNTNGKLNSRILVHEQARVWFNDTMITSWNSTNDANETNGTKFRPYIYVYSDATEAIQPHASFTNCTIGYLGYEMTTRFGIFYADGDPGYYPTGWMHNCTVMENWIGIDIVDTENFNVTNTWFNHSYEAGVVYTGTSHGGYIGDHQSWTHRAGYAGVAVDYHHADCDLDNHGIRLNQVDNMTLHIVDVQDAYTEGIYVSTGCVNHTWDNVTVYDCTNAADDYQIHLDNVDESDFTDCRAYNPDGAASGGNWYVNSSDDNVFTRCIAYDSASHEDFYLGYLTSNSFIDCTANNSDEGFDIVHSNNCSFTNCTAYNHTSVGIALSGTDYVEIVDAIVNNVDASSGIKINDYGSSYSHHNWINSSTSTANQNGISLGAHDAHNNSINSCNFNSNDWGLWSWATAGNNQRDNTFTSCTFNSNAQAGVDIGRCYDLNLVRCTITGNSGEGIEIRQSANVDTTYTYPYNQTGTGNYDWEIDDTSTLDYTGRYVLDGETYDITNVIDGTFDENTVTHSSGDGCWNATTRNLYVSISSSLPSNLVISSWTPTSLYRWSLQATAGTMYAKVGDLASDTSYHKYVGSNDEGSYTSSSSTMLYPTSTAWFNYSGGWSTKLFSLTTTLASVGGNGASGTSTATNTVTVQVTGDGAVIAGATVYIYDSTGTLVATGTTDATGTYTTSLSDGSYLLKANADGYSLTEQALTVSGATSALIALLSGINFWLIFFIVDAIIAICILLYYFRDQIF